MNFYFYVLVFSAYKWLPVTLTPVEEMKMVLNI